MMNYTLSAALDNFYRKELLMYPQALLTRFLLLLLCATLAACMVETGERPLPSWHDGASRQRIISFVESVTNTSSSDYVAPQERIATFDNDGTLWAEQPMYFQLLFALDRIREMAPAHPEWKTQEPYASILEGDIAGALSGGTTAALALVMGTHAGMTAMDFEQQTLDWLAQARHPISGRKYTEMIYQPMLELLDYLRANDFKTYIVSGGGIDFMRPWTEEVYGIPPEQVVGSSIKVNYEVRDGKPVIVRSPEMDFIDDKAGKPLGIHRHIGRRPVIAVGNSDGDFEMLEWSTSGEGARLGILVHHTDAAREWAYDRDSYIGRLVRGLEEGPERGWLIVDMEKDWSTVFSWQ